MNRVLLFLLLLLALPIRIVAIAQPASQIASDFDPARIQALPHHHPQWASPANYTGPVAAGLRLDQMTLVLSRSPEQEIAFRQFLVDQQNPASPSYHQWLTPAQVGERFGLSSEDMDALTGWLQTQGLNVNWISPSRMFIGFGGTAAQIGQAFHTQFSLYSVDGVERMSVDSEPMIPQALAPAIKAIQGLYTIEDKPAHHLITVQTASPEFTLSNGEHFITPADFDLIYNVPGGASGSGQTIGIVGRSRTDFADFTNFRSLTQTAFPNPTEIVPTAFGGVDPGPALTSPPSGSVSTADQSEATLDVLRAGSVAPAANLLLVVATSASGGIETDAQYLVNTTPVPAQIMNISFGECESAAGQARVDFWDTLFQQAAAEGISAFVSSGDSGASGCDADFTTPPTSPQPNSPNYICSSSYATCVGGTEFNDQGADYYWLSTNNANLSSADSYIPEGGWNEPLNSSSGPQVASSGGGVSSFIPTPFWQTGTGVPAARSGRYTPDVAFSASCHDGYFVCFAAGGGNCVKASNGSFQFAGFCGTSAAAPSMAGIAALLNQHEGSSQGSLNQGLYVTAANAEYSYHDITAATSGVTNCNVSTPSMCNNSAPSSTGQSGGQTGYLLNTGYDEVTGLGSLSVANFLNTFDSLMLPQVTATPSASTITVIQPVTVAVTVTGWTNAPAPTGSVSVTNGSYTSAATTLINGSGAISIPAGSLESGGDLLAVKYTPDAASSSIYSSASTTTGVSVELLSPAVTVTPSSNSITTAQSLTATITASGPGSVPTPTGTLSFAVSGYGNFAQTATLSGGSASVTFLAGMFPAGSDLLVADYVPDVLAEKFYANTSASSRIAVTAVVGLTPTVTVTPALADTDSANPLTVAVAVSGGNGNPTPTGTVTLIGPATAGTYISGPSMLSNGSASIVIPAGSLATGYIRLTAVYAPDTASATTYNNTTGTAPVSVFNLTKSIPNMAIFPQSGTITTEQSVWVNVTVANSMGASIASTGSVTLSGGSYSSAPAALSYNEAQFTIPAGVLPLGSDALTAVYTPDTLSSTYYYGATVTNTITVTAPPAPTFNLSGAAVGINRGATTGNTATITITPVNGFQGSVMLSAALASNPSGAQDLPTFSFSTPNPVSITGTAPLTAMLTISTTGSATASNYPDRRSSPWRLGTGTALAGLLLFGISTRRKRICGFLGLLALFAILCGGMSACGGGASAGGGGTTGSGGTTVGTYLVTITGTSGSSSVQSTLSVTVE